MKTIKQDFSERMARLFSDDPESAEQFMQRLTDQIVEKVAARLLAHPEKSYCLPDVTLNKDNYTIVIFGKIYALTESQFRIFSRLYAAAGAWVTGINLSEFGTKSERSDRVVAKLRDIFGAQSIESRRGGYGGFRLVVEKLC